MADFFWRRRVYDRFSPKFQNGSQLQALSDHWFEDYCICTQDKDSGLCLRTFGVRHSYPEFQEVFRLSSRFHLRFVLAGKGFANGIPVQEGDVILFDRNTAYNLSADQDDPFIFAWISFKGEIAEKHLLKIGLNQGTCIYHTENLKEISALFYDMIYIDHPMFDTALYLESRLIFLLSMLQNLQPISNSLPASQRQSKHVYSAIRYLQGNCFRQDFRIGEVAAAIGLNETYLRRIFQNEMKISIREYITDYRLHTAKELLKSSNYNISEISNFVGYRDYRQFYAQFKEKTGLTPSEYMKTSTHSSKS